ncbi:MAG: hypothetical protein ACRENI_01520 [Gemmatimonadaceae bacterium]
MALREFTDSAGKAWKVWNVALDDISASTRAEDFLADCADGWLCFESDKEKRRLIDFPEDWNTLPDAELEQLCARAHGTPVRQSSETTAEFARRQDEMFEPADLASDEPRTFTTPDNRVWIVEECAAPPGSEASSDKNMILRFSSEGVTRELAQYPDDWRRYLPGQLVELALAAHPVHAHETDEDPRQRRDTQQGGPGL